jgi:hypothetical protein
MPVDLDHLIVRSRDKRASAAFLAELLGLPPPSVVGPGGRFHAIRMAGGTPLDFADAGEPFAPQHYAFAVSDPEFDSKARSGDARRPADWPRPCCGRPPGEISPGSRTQQTGCGDAADR